MTVSAFQTPSNTIEHRIAKLAERGLGHEDIAVLLWADGVRLPAREVRRIYFQMHGARRAGATTGRALSSLEAAGSFTRD